MCFLTTFGRAFHEFGPLLRREVWTPYPGVEPPYPRPNFSSLPPPPFFHSDFLPPPIFRQKPPDPLTPGPPTPLSSGPHIIPYTKFSDIQSCKRNIQVICITSIMPVELIVWDTKVCKNTWYWTRHTVVHEYRYYIETHIFDIKYFVGIKQWLSVSMMWGTSNYPD